MIMNELLLRLDWKIECKSLDLVKFKEQISVLLLTTQVVVVIHVEELPHDADHVVDAKV